MTSPQNPLTLLSNTSRHQLRVWVLVRFGLILFLIAFYVTYISLTSIEASASLLAISLFYICFNLLTHIRLSNELPVIEAELFAQYLIDILLLSGCFYFVLGPQNPFVAYLLIPVCFAAATLSKIQSTFLGATAVLCYSLLFFQDAHSVHEHIHIADFHYLGMWISFLTSCFLIVFFISTLNKKLELESQRRQLLLQNYQDQERIIASASQAALLCHELGTPLNNIHFLVDNLTHRHLKTDEVNLLKQEVNQCKHILNSLRSHTKTDASSLVNLEKALTNLKNAMQIIHPNLSLEFYYDAASSTSMQQEHIFILNNLVQNSISANATQILVTVESTTLHNKIKISDNGDGMDFKTLPIVGKKILTSSSGMGIGLYAPNYYLNKAVVQYRLRPIRRRD